MGPDRFICERQGNTSLGVELAVEHLANHSALGPAMSRFTAEERKRGSAFALRILSALESAEADPEDARKSASTHQR